MFCCQKYKVWSAWGGGGKSESKYKDWRRMEFAKYPFQFGEHGSTQGGVLQDSTMRAVATPPRAECNLEPSLFNSFELLQLLAWCRRLRVKRKGRKQD